LSRWQLLSEIAALKQKSGLWGRSKVASATVLCFDDAIDRADIHAARGIVMTNAFHASGRVDNVNIAFADRVSGAFRQASAASNAVVVNFHSHGITLLVEID
jgi:hypothetical protein